MTKTTIDDRNRIMEERLCNGPSRGTAIYDNRGTLRGWMDGRGGLITDPRKSTAFCCPSREQEKSPGAGAPGRRD